MEDNPYLWMRIKDVKYVEARNVYDYRKGNKPFSTQHKTKGLEYNNVLVILKSNWNKYDFASLFCETGKKGTVINRTKNCSMYVVQEPRNIWPSIIQAQQLISSKVLKQCLAKPM